MVLDWMLCGREGEGGLYHLGGRCTMLGARQLGSRGMSLWRRSLHREIYGFVRYVFQGGRSPPI